ncbi:DUF1254 domain-containing protein [Haliea sp. E17]|uniref:DUF1254 domain-containing protein n=1 Tax=Haliea sp. E17 TaxID=3401576 RepID=UPI003AB00218
MFELNPRRRPRAALNSSLLGAALTLGTAFMPGTASAASYHTAGVDQFQMQRLPDILPADEEARETWARALAFDLAVYGRVAALEYDQMYRQAVDKSDPLYTGFNRFAHGRDLAGPGYQPFKSPNADTLYSNAWLDLSNGPVLITVPDTDGRYFTLNFLDFYGSASNISARIQGTRGGRYLVADANWEGPVPEGLTLFRVTTPYAWILMRVLVDNSAELPEVRRLQDRFTIEAVGARPAPAASHFPSPDWQNPEDFLAIMDFVVREVGYPASEEALVYRYRGLGVGGDESPESVWQDPARRRGIEAGFADADQVIERSTAQTGKKTGNWTEALDLGRYGFNYLYRASLNTLGTGANVTDENHPFVTFFDGSGAALDGSETCYQLQLAPPPPVQFFWSVTLYDAQTRELYPNAENRYLVNDRVPDLVRAANGAVTIHFQHTRPAQADSLNWLPTPAGPFYIGLRAQGPGPAIRNGDWKPDDIRRTPCL